MHVACDIVACGMYPERNMNVNGISHISYPYLV